MQNFTLLIIFLFSTVMFYSCNGRDNPQNIKSDANSQVKNTADKLLKRSNFYISDSIFKLNKQIICENIQGYGFIVKSFENAVYVVNRFQGRDDNPYMQKSNIINIDEINENITKTHEFIIPKLRIDRAVFSDFLVTKDYFILLYFKELLLFNKKDCSFKYSIALEKSWDIISSCNNEIYLLNERFGLARNNDSPRAAKLDLSKLKLDEEIDFHIPKGAALTMVSPKRCFGLWKNGFYLSDITEYNIRFYDFKGKLVNQITNIPKSYWTTNDKFKTELDQYTDFDEFRNNLEKYYKISTMHCVDFLNDSTLLVTRNDSKFTDRVLDIWRLKENKWYLLYSDLKINNNTNDELVSSLSIFDLLGHFVINNKLCMGFICSFNIKDPKFSSLTNKEFFNKVNDYNIDNEPNVSLLFFDFIEY